MTALSQTFSTTSENRRWLASVAVGEENTPPESFFRGLLESQPTVEEEMPSHSTTPKLEEREQDLPMSENDNENCEDQGGYIEEFVAALQTATEKYGNSDTAAGLKQATQRLKNIKSTNMLNSVLHTIGSSVCTRGIGTGRGKIPCQPTSIARRGPGQPRGAAPLGKGRRPSCLLNNRGGKRPRNLSVNI